MMTMKTKLTDALAELSNVWRQQIEVDPTDPYDDGYSTAKHECYESLIDVIREHDSAEIAGALRDAERWQPIESAPRDGSEIWAYNGEQARMHWIQGEGYALWVWSDELLSDADPNPEQPTHWRPLPAPPTQESAMQQGGGGGE